MAAIAAAMGANAATRAYKAECKKERDHTLSLPRSQTENLWLVEFAERLRVGPEEPTLQEQSKLNEDGFSKAYALKEAELANSSDTYDRVAWWVYKNLTSRPWFEAFVMFNILAIGISTGLDLETDGGVDNPGIKMFIDLTASVTFVVFTLECALKLVAESWHVERYFQDAENGAFNCFDFTIVAAGFAFLGSDSGGAVGALRLLRLVRLLTFVKGVPQLRGIIVGLVIGMKSVVYILVLLFLVIYLFAIIGVLFLGLNDTARFGTVTTAMLQLFQVSTLASWTNIAYTSWWGCGNYQGDPYTSDNQITGKSRAVTLVGDFQGYKCDEAGIEKHPMTTSIYFALFIFVTAWVVMSLFIGVISIGMFEAFEAMRAEKEADEYMRKISATMPNPAPSMASMAGPRNSGTGENMGNTAFKSLKKAENPLVNRPELAELIDFALADEVVDSIEPSLFYERLKNVARRCQAIQTAGWFNNIITVTIIVVGIFIGIDTDAVMACERFTVNKRSGTSPNCVDSTASVALGYIAQFIFTVELFVKVLAFGKFPMRYLEDPWNKLDGFVVAVGFVEMTPGRVIFEAFPVVVLRLLRLLRVFRLAKALPRLRSIVEALIKGLGSVGWICILMVVFNYIFGCMLMLLFAKNDPFHFGSVGRSMFTILRLATLDSWEQILHINMRGCAEYPNSGYPLIKEGSQCTDSAALGWFTALVFLLVVVIESFVLPTVLIGVVIVSFDEATKRGIVVDKMMEKMRQSIAELDEAELKYFTERRIEALRAVFEEMDADNGMTLDMVELCPFFNYVFFLRFGKNLTQSEQEKLYYILDTDMNNELGFAEFVTFFATVLHLQNKMDRDEEFGKKAFAVRVRDRRGSTKAQTDHEDETSGAPRKGSLRSKWGRLKHDEILSKAWDRVIFAADKAHVDWPSRLRAMFRVHEDQRASRGQSLTSGVQSAAVSLNVKQLGEGLRSMGVKIKVSEAKVLAEDMDDSGDGEITLAEFSEALNNRRVAKAWAPILRLAISNSDDNSESEDDNGHPPSSSSASETWDAKVTAAFSAFDHNADGQLDKAELARGLRQLGVVLFLPEIEALMRTMDADSGGSVSLAEFRVAVRQQQLSRAWPMLLEVADTNSSYAGEWPTKVLQAFQKGLFASASPNSTLSTHEESVVSGLESEQFRLALAEMEIRLDLATVRLLSADIVSIINDSTNNNSSGSGAAEASKAVPQRQGLYSSAAATTRITAAGLMSAVAWKQNEVAWAPVLKWAADVGVEWPDELKLAFEEGDRKPDEASARRLSKALSNSARRSSTDSTRKRSSTGAAARKGSLRRISEQGQGDLSTPLQARLLKLGIGVSDQQLSRMASDGVHGAITCEALAAVMRPKLAANYAYAAAVPHSQEELQKIAMAARGAKDEIKPLESVIVASVDVHRILQRVNQHRNAAAMDALARRLNVLAKEFAREAIRSPTSSKSNSGSSTPMRTSVHILLTTSEPGVSPLHSGWEAVQSSGKTYYYCPDTGETSWELPPGMQNQSQTPTQAPTQAPFAASAALSRDQPVLRLENKSNQKASAERKLPPVNLTPSAQKPRAPKNNKPPRARATSAGTASSSSASSSGEWQATRDPDSGQTYYYHPATGKTSWQKPRSS